MLAAKLPLSGFSVTIPHKQKIIRYLDVVEPLARRIGAVNTVWRKSGKWRGTNTDTDGVTAAAGQTPAPGQIHGADRRQWRRGPRGGLRAGRCGREARHHRPQSRPRARPGRALSEPSS